MKKKRFSLKMLCVTGGLLLSGCDITTVSSAEMSVVVVDINRIYAESDLSGKARERLTAVRNELNKGYEDARQLYASEKDTDDENKNNRLENDRRILQQEWVNEQKMTREILAAAVKETLDEWRQQHPDTRIIVPAHVALSYAPSQDITGDILSALSQKELRLPPLPKVTVRSGNEVNTAEKDTVTEKNSGQVLPRPAK